MQKNIKHTVVVMCVLAILVVTLETITILAEKKDGGSELGVIQMEELEDMLSSSTISGQYIYIGRDSCPSCTAVYPTLCEISEKKDLSILYYSTEQDREDRPERMHELLERIKVESVPTVIKVDMGAITEKYNSEEFIKKFT